MLSVPTATGTFRQSKPLKDTGLVPSFSLLQVEISRLRNSSRLYSVKFATLTFLCKENVQGNCMCVSLKEQASPY